MKLKKLVALAMVGTFAMSAVGCGDSEKVASTSAPKIESNGYVEKADGSIDTGTQDGDTFYVTEEKSSEGETSTFDKNDFLGVSDGATYTNKNYDFSFTLPEDFQAQDSSEVMKSNNIGDVSTLSSSEIFDKLSAKSGGYIITYEAVNQEQTGQIVVMMNYLPIDKDDRLNQVATSEEAQQAEMKKQGISTTDYQIAECKFKDLYTVKLSYVMVQDSTQKKGYVSLYYIFNDETDMALVYSVNAKDENVYKTIDSLFH